MTLLNDKQIIEANRAMAKLNGTGMISPMVTKQIRSRGKNKVISYGLSSFGYDIRLSKHIYIPQGNPAVTVIDPKGNRRDRSKVLWESRTIDRHGFEIPPHGYALASSVERFHIPDNVVAVCLGKSTYARCGLVVNVTPLEPGWQGFLTLEISNTTNFKVLIYANEGIAQLLFHQGERPITTYADRDGKYQNQPDAPVPPRL